MVPLLKFHVTSGSSVLSVTTILRRNIQFGAAMKIQEKGAFFGTVLMALTLVGCGTPQFEDNSLSSSNGAPNPCAFLREQAFASKIPDEVDYLCGAGQGLTALHAASLATILDVADVRRPANSARFMFAGTNVESGDIEKKYAFDHLFCADFERYRGVFESAAYKDVESITASNGSESGCDFHFKGKKFVVYQPQYKGRQEFAINADHSIIVSASYSTESISLVKKSSSLTIVAVSDDKLRIFSMSDVVTDTKGFPDQAHDRIKAAAAASLRSFKATANVGL